MSLPRQHRHELRGHAFFINDYATGRRFQPPERMFLTAAARDAKTAVAFEAIGTRRAKPGRTVLRATPRMLAVNTRPWVQGRLEPIE